ncbi:hypothetical protein [Synechococcus sp. CCY 9618]|uniref:hypothetical protein n=1 Tax=Synechococcus sp. CCY 9618 TaxID=2815602 RepID=UPI001C22266C|nr:hypothetical protein [Synechococcus sp. CCY 9618]
MLLGVTVLAGGCQFTGVSEGGRERCRQRGAGAGDPVRAALAYVRCLPTTDRSLAIENATSRAAAARQAALDACRSRQQRISALMASLREAEQELAAARNAPFRPSEAAPPPLDARREARYRQEDQQLDRERYEAAFDAWEQRVAGQRARWREERATRIESAQARLDRDFLALKTLQPDLFNAPESIEFDPEVARRVTNGCEGTG